VLPFLGQAITNHTGAKSRLLSSSLTLILLSMFLMWRPFQANSFVTLTLNGTPEDTAPLLGMLTGCSKYLQSWNQYLRLRVVARKRPRKAIPAQPYLHNTSPKYATFKALGTRRRAAENTRDDLSGGIEDSDLLDVDIGYTARPCQDSLSLLYIQDQD
jgi:hypothetical protein